MRMTKWMKLAAVAMAVAYTAAPLTVLAADKTDKKAKPYPLKTCIVTDEELGSMGDAFVFAHKGQEIKLCCKGCQKDFKKNPDKYLKKLTDKNKKK